MNIFVAGVHGVGKTYLAARLPSTLGFTHTSASKLIKEERAMPSWGVDKRVSDVDANQLALATAVKRYNNTGTPLLLDGHFVLLDGSGNFVRLGTDVFGTLNISGVVLLEAEPQVIAARINERDGRIVDIDHLSDFIVAERSQAKIVCDGLGIPMRVLVDPSPQAFAEAVSVLERTVGD